MRLERADEALCEYRATVTRNLRQSARLHSSTFQPNCSPQGRIDLTTEY
jgi:hypothetical protein